MTKREKIDKWSLLYWFLKHYVVRPAYFFYYKKFLVVHEEKIPDDQPNIIAPNHQNALMDALAFVTGIRFQTIFMARADIFTTRFITKVLTFLKILPVYRIRDGRENLQKNDDMFDYAEQVLRHKYNPLLLFPEGNHGEYRRLRPLVKGIFRIAFQGQEPYGSKPGVKIIPTGIDYRDYYKFRQTQLVVFGDPIEVADYWKEYQENPAIGMNMLRDRLSEELKKVMIHIETEEYYELYMRLRNITNKALCKKLGLKHRNLYDAFRADKKMIAALDKLLMDSPEKIADLNTKFQEYNGLMKTLNFRDWTAQKPKYSILLNFFAIVASVVVWPIALLGFINNWPHFLIPPVFARKIRDPQFISTTKWGAGFVLFMLYYFILTVLAVIFIPIWWIALIYITTLKVSGIFLMMYRTFLIKSIARIRYSWKIMRKKKDMIRFRQLHEELVQFVIQIMD